MIMEKQKKVFFLCRIVSDIIEETIQGLERFKTIKDNNVKLLVTQIEGGKLLSQQISKMKADLKVIEVTVLKEQELMRFILQLNDSSKQLLVIGNEKLLMY